MKNYIIVLLSVLMSIMSLKANAYPRVVDYVDNICYSFDEIKKEASIFPGSARDNRKNFVIPSSVQYKGKTYIVTGIDDYSFANWNEKVSFTIPNTVTEIGNGAFQNCSGLTSVTIPNSVTSIGNAAFKGSGVMELSIPDGVVEIGDEAFMNCSNLGSLTIPNGVSSIGTKMCYNCKHLTYVTIPNSVTEIGDSAFMNCTSLKSVDIPYSVTKIGRSAFYGCSGLTDAYLYNGIESIGRYAFRECCNLSSIDIPASVTDMGEYCFYGCSSLTSVTLSGSLKIISDAAFMNCTSLTSFTIPGSVTTIGWGTFCGCTGLTSIIFPSGITSIGDYTFFGCTGLTSFDIPESVTSIGEEAFSGCTGLTSMDIPGRVTSIGVRAFQDCSGLTSVTIPNSVTSIGGEAFSGCSGLTSVTIPNSVTSLVGFTGCTGLTSVTIPESVTSIGYGAFQDCKSLASIHLPDGITSIRGFAFSGCTGLTSIDIPGRVTSIEECAFKGCTGLTSIDIPSSVIKISNGVFQNCRGLVSVTISEKYPSIGEMAFDACTGLMDVYCYSNSVPLYGNAFASLNTKKMTLHVPSILVDSYNESELWNTFGNIVALPETYSLVYMVEDKEYKTIDVEYGTAITPEAEPTKEGYTFSGWSEIPATMPAKDVTITGSFTINKYKMIYKVDGEEYKTLEVEYGSVITPEAEPTKEGYTFSGWSGIPETMPANDVTITGSFTIVDENQDIKVDDDGRWTKYVVTLGTAGVVSHEDYPNLFDNDTSTKWCVTDVSGTIYVEFDATHSIKPIGYVLTTAIDTYPFCLDRNPKSWVIKGRNSTSDAWSTLTTVANAVMPTGNCISNTYPLNTNSAYRYYRFEVTSLVGGDIFQLSEFCFLVGENPDEIQNINTAEGEYQIYTLDGRQVEGLQKGVNIIKFKNGGTQKIYVK